MEAHNKPIEDNPFLKTEDPYAEMKAKASEVPQELLEVQRMCYEVHTANPTGAHLRKTLIENFMTSTMINVHNLPADPWFIAAYEMGLKKGVAMCWEHADMHAKRIAGVNG